MNVAAEASARPRHSGLALFVGNSPTLAIVGRGREGGLLAVRTACQTYFLINCETIDEW